MQFDGRRVLYTWIGGTRRDWRGQGIFRALTEQQELWAIEQGFDEIVVKTKNRFYEMRGTLDHLRFEVVKYERNAGDNAESKVYLSKKLLPEMSHEAPQRQDRRLADALYSRPIPQLLSNPSNSQVSIAHLTCMRRAYSLRPSCRCAPSNSRSC